MKKNEKRDGEICGVKWKFEEVDEEGSERENKEMAEGRGEVSVKSRWREERKERENRKTRRKKE